MKYIKKFMLFESYFNDYNNIKDIIDDLEDHYDIHLKKSNFYYDTLSLKFKFKKIKKDKLNTLINWFATAMLRLDLIKIEYRHKLYIFNIKSYEYDIEEINQDSFILDINFNGNSKDLIEFLIIEYDKDPEFIKKEISSLNRNEFINKMFEFYCRSVFNKPNFEMLEAFRTDKNEFLEPIKFNDIRLPYNLHENYKIDITPIFLEEVYKNSGLIFRMGLTSSYLWASSVKRDKYGDVPISEQTDKKLKELGLDNLTWEDIFVKIWKQY